MSGSITDKDKADNKDVPETDAQKEIIATVYYQGKTHPDGHFLLYKKGANGTGKKDIKWTGSVGSNRWSKEPGQYTVCLQPADKFKKEEGGCKTVTKKAKKTLQVNFGDPDKAWDKVHAGDEDEGEEAKCKIDGGLGWILCPVFNLLGGISDAAYKVVALMLTVPPIMTNGDTQGVYSAWKGMRNIANVAFVIAFLIIIFSQVTSIGFSNYNIKKMVPRLVMAAILVNISFWICALAVDASNIIGSGIKALFDGMTEGIAVTGDNSSFWSGNGPAFGAIVLGVVSGTLIAATTDIFMLLAGLVPVIITVFIAILTVFVVLTARQAIIILLIVISPLAFVAMLLPNTENWFTRWRQLFQIMLLMFPIIAAIFGASALAAIVIMNSTDNVAVQILGAGIAVVPLALTPIVMKTAGGMLNKIGAFVNNPNRGPLDKLRKKSEDYKAYRGNQIMKKQLDGKGLYATKGLSTRVSKRMAAKGEKAKASAEAAEAGFMLDNNDKKAAANLRSAAAGANSAAAAKATADFDASDARDALGVSGQDFQLNAALRSQEKIGENQAIKEWQDVHGPKDADALGEALRKAIERDDELEAQAIENMLDGLGNKGADVMASVVADKDDSMSSTMRTELSRNLGGAMMGKNEILKGWATSTSPEFDENGQLVMEDAKDNNGNVIHDENGKVKKQVKLKADEPKLDENGKTMTNTDGSVKMKGLNKSYADSEKNVLSSEMKLDKILGQSSTVQHKIITEGKMSVETAQAALNPNNISKFEAKDIAAMQKIVADAAKSGASSTSAAKPAPSSNPGTLKVEHSYTGTPPSAPAAPAAPSNQSTSAPKAETFAQRDARIRNANRDMTGN
ncbi:MAG: type IV secretion system protein [bacterium]|nr:type IV secretion system protein [bacterium]